MTGFHLWNVTGSEESFGVWLRRSRCNSEEDGRGGEEEEESYRTNTVFSWADARNVLRGFVRVSFSEVALVYVALTRLIGTEGLTVLACCRGFTRRGQSFPLRFTATRELKRGKFPVAKKSDF